MSILSTSPAKSFLSKRKSQPDIIQENSHIQQNLFTSDKINSKDFCNSFWGDDNGIRGFEALTGKVKVSTKTIEDLKYFWKERASIEEDYAKRLGKLSKLVIGNDETGALFDSLMSLGNELEQISHNHFTLSQSMRRDLEAETSDWVNRMHSFKKSSLASIEKKFKVLQTQENYVEKSKARYTDNCVSINTFTAQKSLLQGKDLDRVESKLEKAKAAVSANERDYINFVRALSDTRKRWEVDWRMFCDQFQDEEEQRIEFLKNHLWTYANEVSTVCVADDESCEKVRQALEQVDPEIDIEIFVEESSTGNMLPQQATFVDFSRETQAPSPAPRYASFHRNSIRPLDLPPPPKPLGVSNSIKNSQPVKEVEDIEIKNIVDKPPVSPKKVVDENAKQSKHQPKKSQDNDNKSTFKVPELPPRSEQRSRNQNEVENAKYEEQNEPPKPEPKDYNNKDNEEVDELAAALAQLRNAPPATGNLRANVAAQVKEKSPKIRHNSVSQPDKQQQQQTSLIPPGSSPTKQPNQPNYSNLQNYKGLNDLTSSQMQALQIQHKYAPHTTPPFPAMMQRPSSAQSSAGGPVEDVLSSYHQQLPHERMRRNSQLQLQQQQQQAMQQNRTPSPGRGTLTSHERSPSREGFAGIGAGGTSNSRQPSPSIRAQTPHRSQSPLGIQLDASGGVAHDQMAEDYKAKRRSVSPSPTPIQQQNQQPQQIDQQQVQMQQAQAYYQYQMMMAQQQQQYYQYQQQMQQQQQYQKPQQPQQPPYIMSGTPGPQLNPQRYTATPGPVMNVYQQQQRSASPSVSSSVSPSTVPMMYNNATITQSQTPFIHPIQTQQLSQYSSTPTPISATSGNNNMYRQPSPTPTIMSGSPNKQNSEPLFHVKALYDYSAQTEEEFDFKAGDVIAVFKTPEDGWWTGHLLDESRFINGKTLFPSNFVSLF